MSDEEGHKIKRKKSAKRQLISADEPVAKKSAKKSKQNSLSEEGVKVLNGSKDFPTWLEMTDSEDEFQSSPIRKVKTDVDTNTEETEMSPKKSPKKKKKRQSEKLTTADREDIEVKYDEPTPKKSKKGKKHVTSLRNIPTNGDIDAQVPDSEEDNVFQKSPKVQLSQKKSSKSPKNVFAEHEDLDSVDEQSDFVQLKEESSASPEPEPTQSPDKKPSPAEFSVVPTEAAELPDSHVAVKEEPTKRVKKITKVPLKEQVTSGVHYKVKKVHEKICKNCSEPVKVKSKTSLRDMGTQTADSALMNSVKTRRLGTSPRVKTALTVADNDRIMLGKRKGKEDALHGSSTNQELTEEQIEYLRTLTVCLKYQVLPQHDIETTAGCRALTPTEKVQFETYAPLRSGSWLVHEDEIILKNWKKFCKRHDWDEKLTQAFSGWRHKGQYYMPKFEDRKKFLQFLAHGLPQRALSSVHMRFKTLFGKVRTDRYTPIEDDILLERLASLTDKNKSTYLADLSAELNRSRQSLWRRYKILQQRIA